MTCFNDFITPCCWQTYYIAFPTFEKSIVIMHVMFYDKTLEKN